MSEVFQAKLRRIGSSVGVLIPKEQLDDLDVDVGDEIDVALLKHRNRAEWQKEVNQTFGMAKRAGPFVRDKKTREF